MGNRGLKENLDIVTNIMVIAGVLLLAVLLYRSVLRSREATRQTQPAADTILPALPGYSWGSHNQTLVIAMRKGCHFCENSIPFYQTLLQEEKNGRSKAHLLSVYPDDEVDAKQVLRNAQLDLPVVASYSLPQLHISGTPTLVLVDRAGRVERAWDGEQDSEGQKEVRDAVLK